MPKQDSVEIIDAVVNPRDLSVAVAKVIIDLSRPSQLAEDFHRALRDHPAIRLTYCALDPKLFEALEVCMGERLSFKKASLKVYGHPGKASSICRLKARIKTCQTLTAPSSTNCANRLSRKIRGSLLSRGKMRTAMR